MRSDEASETKESRRTRRECRCAPIDEEFGGSLARCPLYPSIVLPSGPTPIYPLIFLLLSLTSNFFGVLSSKNSTLLARISVPAAWNLNRGMVLEGQTRVATAGRVTGPIWMGILSGTELPVFATSLAFCPFRTNSSFSESLFLSFSLFRFSSSFFIFFLPLIFGITDRKKIFNRIAFPPSPFNRESS